MLTGSMAMNYYAQPRMTRDIDVVVELEPRDAQRIAALLAHDFVWELEAVPDAALRRGMFNIIHREWVVKIDFVVRKESAYRGEEFKRRRQVEIEGKPTWIVGPEDLLLSKLHWAKDSPSELQLRDVRNLADSVPGLDWNYINHWAAEIGVSALLDEVRS
jgi:hypothetical protein